MIYGNAISKSPDEKTDPIFSIFNNIKDMLPERETSLWRTPIFFRKIGPQNLQAPFFTRAPESHVAVTSEKKRKPFQDTRVGFGNIKVFHKRAPLASSILLGNHGEGT